MRFGGRPAVLSLALFVVLCGLLAGCGGGGDGSNGGSENGGSENGGGGGGENAQGGEAKKDAPERKVLIGTVKRANAESRRFAVLPRAGGEQQNPQTVAFKIRKNANITLGDKGAEVADIKGNQQAQVEYVVENEVNRAVSVQLFEGAEDSPSEGGEPNAGGDGGGDGGGG